MSRSTKVTLIFALIGFVVSSSIVITTMYQVNQQGAQLEIQRINMAAELAQQDSFSRLQRKYETSTSDRQQLQSLFLLSEADSVELLNYVESLAPEMGMSLQTERAELSPTEEDSGWAVIDFSLVGSRSAVENYIKIIETLPYVLRVDDVSLINSSGSEWKAETTVRVQYLNYDS